MVPNAKRAALGPPFFVPMASRETALEAAVQALRPPLPDVGSPWGGSAGRPAFRLPGRFRDWTDAKYCELFIPKGCIVRGRAGGPHTLL